MKSEFLNIIDNLICFFERKDFVCECSTKTRNLGLDLILVLANENMEMVYELVTVVYIVCLIEQIIF